MPFASVTLAMALAAPSTTGFIDQNLEIGDTVVLRDCQGILWKIGNANCHIPLGQQAQYPGCGVNLPADQDALVEFDYLRLQ